MGWNPVGDGRTLGLGYGNSILVPKGDENAAYLGDLPSYDSVFWRDGGFVIGDYDGEDECGIGHYSHVFAGAEPLTRKDARIVNRFWTEANARFGRTVFTRMLPER